MTVLNRSLELAEGLARRRLRLVLAESCTGGRASAELIEVPGISTWFCGAAVTYRESVKRDWLRVSAAVLRQSTAESQETTDAMALGVLSITSEADLACAITGHLGPNVDLAVDGWLFLAIATRASSNTSSKTEPTADLVLPQVVYQNSIRLQSQQRPQRQVEAAHWMLGEIADFLSRLPSES
jgi:nicotinamide-nucleotide amidase